MYIYVTWAFMKDGGVFGTKRTKKRKRGNIVRLLLSGRVEATSDSTLSHVAVYVSLSRHHDREEKI